jgi:RHS repeat-associated protein
VKKATGSATTIYLVATVNPSGYPQVVEELSVSGGTTNLSKVYSYGLDLITQRAPGVKTNFFGYDGLGSTRFLSDLNSSITETYGYDAYGTLIVSNTSPTAAYLYTGEQWDSDLKQYYLRQRMLDPNLGRFPTMDPVQGNLDEPLTLNKYLYASANAVNRIDPNGLADWNLNSLLVTAGTITTLASQQLATLVQRTGPAFQAGGRQLGLILQEFGFLAQNTALRVIRLFQASVNNLRLIENMQRGSRVIDFTLQYGQRVMDLEAKYKLPSQTGEALSRLVAQAQASIAAGQAQTVIWTLKEPTLQELQLVTQQLGSAASKVQFVNGIDGLARYMAFFFGF